MNNLFKFIPLLAVVAFSENALCVCGESVLDKKISNDRLYTANGNTLYECDSDKCTNNTYIMAEKGFELNGAKIDQRTPYSCGTDIFDDRWHDLSKYWLSCGRGFGFTDFYKKPNFNDTKKIHFENTDNHNYYNYGHSGGCLVENEAWIECRAAFDRGQNVYWNTDSQSCFCKINSEQYENGSCVDRSKKEEKNDDGSDKKTEFCPFDDFNVTIKSPSDCGSKQYDFIGVIEIVNGIPLQNTYKTITYAEYEAYAGPNKPEILCGSCSPQQEPITPAPANCPFTEYGYKKDITKPTDCNTPDLFVGVIEENNSYISINKQGFESRKLNSVICGICLDNSNYATKCMTAISSGESVVWNGRQCLCVGHKAGWDWDVNQGKCVKTQQQPGCSVRRGCDKMSSPAREACKLCCNIDANIANWDASANQCKCTNNNPFNLNAEKGQWCAITAPVETCPPDTEQRLAEWERNYSGNRQIMDLINRIRELCKKSPFDSAEYNRLINQILAIINNANIENLSGKLSAMQAKFTTSHWTDKEGNFNKKRLVSDSIAATVLGTTGGLITSHIMKKKQAENGFDALQCTVGGQSVASWGDEFTVGIQ